MSIVVKMLRLPTDLKFKLFNLAIIQDIPTEQYNTIIQFYLNKGWKKKFDYMGFDKGIDYDRIDLKNNKIKLRFEWDNWFEGKISGPKEEIVEISKQFKITSTNKINWN